MGKSRIALGVLSFALLGAVLGYVLASAFMMFRWSGIGADIDFLMLARGYLPSLSRNCHVLSLSPECEAFLTQKNMHKRCLSRSLSPNLIAKLHQ